MTTPTDRSVTALVGTVLVGYGLLAWAAVAPGLNLVGGLLALVLTLAVLAVQLGYVSRPGVHRSREGAAVALLALACLTFVPVFAIGLGWIGLAGFLVGSLLLLLSSRPGLAGLAGLAVVVVVGVLVGLAGASWLAVATSALGTLVTGLVVAGLTRLWEMTPPAPAAEPASAAEPAADPEAEPASAAEPEAEAVAEVEPPLAGRLRVARKELDDAGIELSVLGEDVELPEEVGTLFAELVRVAVAHAARHPDAATCRVTVARRGAEARIVVTHDGATDDPAPADFEALGDRFDALDGSVLAERDGTEFTVEGRLPLPA